MKVNEIWIKIENREQADSVEEYIRSLTSEYSGDSEIMLYLNDEKAIKRMPKSCNLCVGIMPLLEEKYGKENIKIESRYAYVCSQKESLERLADTLERIASTLDSIDISLSNLTDEKGIQYMKGEIETF